MLKKNMHTPIELIFMKYSTFLCSLLLCSFLLNSPLLAQSISGRITDAQAKPVAAASVVLRQGTDSSILKATVANEAGVFAFDFTLQMHMWLQVSAVGYYDTLVGLANAVVNIQLRPMTGELDNVVVSARKPMIEVRPDKLIFNVENSINAAGSNALELLRKSPGVVVDKDDNLQMGGKNGVMVYIDGKPSPLAGTDLSAYLRSLNSANVEAIEIITNPSARYDAAGNAGIVNIRLKKNKSYGWNSTLNAGWAVGIFPKYNGGATLNYRNKKLNVFGSYDVNQSRNRSFLNLYRLQNDSIFDQRSSFVNSSLAHNTKAGIDLFVSKRQTLGVLVLANFSNNSGTGSSSTPIAAQNNKIPNRILTANSQSSSRRNNFTANLNYKLEDTTGRQLTADADYGLYVLDSDGIVPNLYSDAQTGALLSQTTFGTVTPVQINLYSLKADYTQPLWKGSFSTGAKASWVHTDNDFRFFNYPNQQAELDTMRSNRFGYTENIFALYGMYSRQVKKINWQAGLRAEHTLSNGELTSAVAVANKQVRRSYLSLFPNAGLSLSVNEKHSFGLSYSRRIDRPRYQDLNPFENRIDELTYQKGNPFLRPQFTHLVELRHTYNYTLTTTLSYSHVQDVFAQVTDTIEGSRNFLQQRNLARQQILNLNVSYPFQLTAWWQVYANASMYYQHYRGGAANAGLWLSAFTATLYQQHSFTLPKGWSAELSSYYNSPGIWGGTYQTRSIWGLDAGVMKKLWQDKAQVKLTVTDLFFTYPWRGVNEFGGLYIKGSGGWESRQLRLNFTCFLGNRQVKQARNRNTGLQDLKDRVD